MRVFSIPPGAPFLETLVEACLDGRFGFRLERESRDLSDAVIYVPTRRSARALAHAFASAVKPRAVLLPRIVPLGDPADLEEQAILADGFGLAEQEPTPPALDPLSRRFTLLRLVEAWRSREDAAASGGYTPGAGLADSFALAGDLARLIDEATIEEAEWSRIADLADAGFDEHWRRTRAFLEIAGRAWPQHLKDLGFVDEAQRRGMLLRAEAERLRRRPPAHPVIAAGSTGTVPATAELLAAIARSPQGAVVLPGLDLAMDDAAWSAVADDDGRAGGQPGHPQSALKRLLGRFGIRREAVTAVGGSAPRLAARQEVISAAMRPAEATQDWMDLRAALERRIDEGLSGVSLIEAQDEREEALAIAVALRETLKHEGRTAALVTPDRALAERVAVELGRWGVRADDSAGAPLDRTPLGGLARLVLHAALEDFAPAAVSALLANACLRFPGEAPLADALAALELAGFRGVELRAGLAGLAAALDGAEDRIADRHAIGPVRRISPERLAAARRLLAFTVRALEDLAAAARQPMSIAAFAEIHAAAVAALAGDRSAEGSDGKALAGLFDGLIKQGVSTIAAFADYAAIFEGEARSLAVPPASPVQGRIKIWGLLEARLLSADRIVLGGLNEGVWPPQPRQDPFLNRAMRHALALSQPERRIGQSAHDFVQALAAPDVVICRARTVEGTPMVASRFLRRLEAFVGKDHMDALARRGARYVASARALDDAPPISPAERPNPTPAAALQPVALSVTDIEKLFRDPYAIYARDVLGLRPLDPLIVAPDARDRGTVIHAALEAFLKAAEAGWPQDPLGLLLAIGREKFGELPDDASVRAFWRPAFEAGAAWFVNDMQDRRRRVVRRVPEAYGRLPIALPDGASFTLSGRGDLFELMEDGTLAITDFKTGAAPGNDEVKSGRQPQLTLLAAMAMAGVVDGVPAAPVSAIRYLRIGLRPGAAYIPFKDGEPGLGDTAQRHCAMLRARLARLRAGHEGFTSRRMMKKAKDGGDYDHLARVREWLSAGAEDG